MAEPLTATDAIRLGVRTKAIEIKFGGAVLQCNTLKRFLHVRKMLKKDMFYFLNYSWI